MTRTEPTFIARGLKAHANRTPGARLSTKRRPRGGVSCAFRSWVQWHASVAARVPMTACHLPKTQDFHEPPLLASLGLNAGAFATKQTILWSRPAGAAVGTPNPGKAGHIAVTNATHFVAAGGMGALGSEDMPSSTADVLEIGEPCGYSRASKICDGGRADRATMLQLYSLQATPGLAGSRACSAQAQPSLW